MDGVPAVGYMIKWRNVVMPVIENFAKVLLKHKAALAILLTLSVIFILSFIYTSATLGLNCVVEGGLNLKLIHINFKAFSPKDVEINKNNAGIKATSTDDEAAMKMAPLEAKAGCRDLKSFQQMPSFNLSKSAAGRLLSGCKDILPPDQQKIVAANTYLFCLNVLESHGSLPEGRRACSLYPGEKPLIKSTFDDDRNNERTRKADGISSYCYDLAASNIEVLFKHYKNVLNQYANKYPFIIVDEFQDAVDIQRRIFKACMTDANVLCLVDPEKRFFGFGPNNDPRRIEAVLIRTNPYVADLSISLDEDHIFRNTAINPYDHDVPGDVERSLASSQVLVIAPLLERPKKLPAIAVRLILTMKAQFLNIKKCRAAPRYCC